MKIIYISLDFKDACLKNFQLFPNICSSQDLISCPGQLRTDGARNVESGENIKTNFRFDH